MTDRSSTKQTTKTIAPPILEESKYRVMLGNLNALLKLEIPSLEFLFSLLKDQDAEVTRKIVQYLLALGERSIPLLLLAMKYDNVGVRLAAIQILGKTKSATPIPHLIQHLNSGEWETCIAVVSALQEIGPRVVPHLLQAVENAEDPYFKNYIAYALIVLGEVSAIERLETVICDENPDICGNAAMILGKLGTAKAACILLRGLVEHCRRIQNYESQGDMPKSFDWIAAKAHIASALVKLGQAAYNQLVETLPTVTYSLPLCKTIVSILGEIGNRDAVPVMLDFLEGNLPLFDQLLPTVLVALEKLKDIRSLPLLERVLSAATRDKNLYESAIKALGHLHHPHADRLLVQCLESPESAIRYYALAAFSKRDCEAAIAPLIKLLQDQHPMIHGQASMLLEKLGSVVLPELFVAIQHAPDDRPQARNLLRKMGLTAVKRLLPKDDLKCQDYGNILSQIIEFATARRTPK